MKNEYETRFAGQLMLDAALFKKYFIYGDLFTDINVRRIVATMSNLHAEGVRPDPVTIKDKDGSSDSVTLSQMLDVGSTANADFYYHELQNAHKKRKLAMIGRALTDHLERTKEADKIITDISEQVLELTKISGKDELVKLSEVLIPWISLVEERYKNKGKLPGITTGFDGLDSYTLGFQNKNMIVVGARPSDGKTAVMLNMALAAAKEKNVAIINLESNNTEMVTRFVSQTAALNGNSLLTGKLKHSDFDRMNDACKTLYDKNIWLYDEPNISIEKIVQKARQAVLLHKVEIIFIDYIQIIRNNGNFGTKREKVEDVSIRLKELARELDIPIVVMAQLHRKEGKAPPCMDDFKESGQIEQDADVAILIHHERDKEDGSIEKSWFIVDKNRNGQKGRIEVIFQAKYVRFMELEK